MIITQSEEGKTAHILSFDNTLADKYIHLQNTEQLMILDISNQKVLNINRNDF